MLRAQPIHTTTIITIDREYRPNLISGGELRSSKFAATSPGVQVSVFFTKRDFISLCYQILIDVCLAILSPIHANPQ